MDETGYLAENEIYCAVVAEGGHRRNITGNVVITRSPALHPGDIQCVTAVDVPIDSPLRSLHNMVVFSSKGERDLPSKLSGGDLDGDLYNVIWDHRLYPQTLYQPAEYEAAEPIDIGREVARSDITEFLITFMENDNLGLIATLHQILADRAEDGTLDETCINVAGFHSTAVDFSKSGIPVSRTITQVIFTKQLQVDRLKLPKYPPARPDFLAPGPHALIEAEVKIEEIDDEDSIDATNEVDEANSYGPLKTIHYPSQKILGRLYRDIDEHQFLEQLQAQSRSKRAHSQSLMQKLWDYVEHRTMMIEWRHYIAFASNVKEKSVLIMNPLDTLSTGAVISLSKTLY